MAQPAAHEVWKGQILVFPAPCNYRWACDPTWTGGPKFAKIFWKTPLPQRENGKGDPIPSHSGFWMLSSYKNVMLGAVAPSL